MCACSRVEHSHTGESDTMQAGGCRFGCMSKGSVLAIRQKGKCGNRRAVRVGIKVHLPAIKYGTKHLILPDILAPPVS